EGRRRQRRAQLLRKHTQPEIAEPRSPQGLRNRRAGPAHGGNLLPQAKVVGLSSLEHASHGRGGAALAQKFARLLAQCLQVIAEIEIHGVAFPSIASAAYVRAVVSRSEPPLSATCCNNSEGR